MRFFKEYKKQIIIILLFFSIIISLLSVGKSSGIPVISDIAGVIVTPIQKLSSNTSKFFKEKFEAFANTSDLTNQINELEAENQRLLYQNKRLNLYEQENIRLSKLLDLSQKYKDYKTSGTSVIGKDPGSYFCTFLIDKGKNDKITSDMVLVSSGGLVGKITETRNNFSKAQSILDTKSSVSAMSLRTGDLGVVKGNYSYSSSGLCIMEYIDSEAEIIVGDEIVTSNLSEIYPPGITIGTVKEITQDKNELTKIAIIEPQADLKHLDSLLIVEYDKEEK